MPFVHKTPWPALLLLGLCLGTPWPALADEWDDALKVVARTGPDNPGTPQTRAACRKLAAGNVTLLPRLLEAMDTDNPVAGNWLRSAYEELVSRELAAGASFPAEFLQTYVADPARAGKSRRLVLRLLETVTPEFGPALLPTLLDDPEFRGEAVTLQLAAGDQLAAAGDADAARAVYLQALAHARDAGHAAQAAGKVRQLGGEASLTAHFGFVTDWYVIGPFAAPGFASFKTRFPPEEGVDITASVLDASGEALTWRRRLVPDEMGQMNLIQAIGPHAECAGYAYAELIFPEERQAEVRCGADDNCTLWLNGQQVLAREQWLNGSRLDRFIVPVTLQAGVNRLLVKICQGPQHKDPAVPNNWTLQLRICDSSGLGLPVESAWPGKATE